MDSEEYFVIDTDCGSDDAVAIMLALNCIQRESNSNRKLLGIFCCPGNTTVDKVARNVLLTLDLMNEHNVKVYKGSHCSILKKYDSYEYYGNDGLGNSVSGDEVMRSKVEEESGIQALISIVRKYPKKVTIVCLGPLTNLALAYLLDAEFFDLTKEVYILGGNHTGFGNVTPSAEFNFYYDPEAVHITLKNAVCPITIVPWESCHLHMSWDVYNKLIEIPTTKAAFFKKITQYLVDRLRKNKVKGIDLSDFLVMAAYLNPNTILETRHWTAQIELNGELTRGQLAVNKQRENISGFRFVTKIDYQIVNEMYEVMLR